MRRRAFLRTAAGCVRLPRRRASIRRATGPRLAYGWTADSSVARRAGLIGPGARKGLAPRSGASAISRGSRAIPHKLTFFDWRIDARATRAAQFNNRRRANFINCAAQRPTARVYLAVRARPRRSGPADRSEWSGLFIACVLRKARIAGA